MIGSLRGTVREIHASFFLLDVQGIGYHVKSTPSVLSALKLDEECFVCVYDHVREDARDLYGFFTRSDEELFARLLTVSGVGPKVALTILSLGTAELVRHAILDGDLTTLTSVPGVGMKTAQKIVLDLKGQLVEEGTMNTKDAEVVEALVSLGYTAQSARAALKSVPREIVDVSARVREALKYFGK